VGNFEQIDSNVFQEVVMASEHRDVQFQFSKEVINGKGYVHRLD
jgi:hypothetical protein